MYDPKTNKFPYPEETDKHYLKVKKNAGIVFDGSYPYVDDSRSFRFKQGVVRFLLNLIVFPAATLRMGLKIRGRENLKKYRDLIKKGVVSCCNHVHMWDYIAIMKAARPFRTNILVWAPNINGENGKLIRSVGGIPIPEGNLGGTRAYLSSIKKLLEGGGWLHIYAEGSMWEYYAPIRPFKRGPAYFACKNRRPVIPLAFSYRKAGLIRRKLFGQIACFDLSVGEPLFPDEALIGDEQIDELTIRCRDAVCRLAGIDPEKNIYPPLFNDSKRIDYYTDKYGVGYKGSW